MAGLLLAVAGLSGCAPPSSPTEDAGPVETPDTPGLIHVPSPIAVRALSVRVSAPHARSVTVQHCNGDPGWRLQRIEGDRLHEVWSGEADACASPPIRIAAGMSHAFDLAAYNGARSPLKAGRYRLVLHALQWADGHPVDSELRRSNDFELLVPGA